MIISLKGGLGNQLFQWALGRALEHRGYPVLFETSLLDASPDRRCLLGELGLNFATVPLPLSNSQINEISLRFNPKILSLINSDWTLNGYWQSEKYFADIAGEIRQEIFDETKRLYFVTLSNATITDEHFIKKAQQSCFIHVRRSDNLRPTSTLYHGLTDATQAPYYKRAIKIMREKFPGITFYVFSDDPEWIEANMTDSDMVCVTHNAPSFTVDETGNLRKNSQGREVEDLYLMSLCKHAIIANSTFSWWGAWLNHQEGSSDRLVIAPDPWFSGKTDLDSSDILPERWMKVSTQ